MRNKTNHSYANICTINSVDAVCEQLNLFKEEKAFLDGRSNSQQNSLGFCGSIKYIFILIFFCLKSNQEPKLSFMISVFFWY